MNEPDDNDPSINISRDAILAMLVVDDVLGEHCTGHRIEHGFLRGWILKNRTTGEVWATYRFLYPDGKRSWSRMRPNADAQQSAGEVAENLRSVMDKIFTTAMVQFKAPPQCKCEWFFPPAGADVEQTFAWMEKSDLFEPAKIMPAKSPA